MQLITKATLTPTVLFAFLCLAPKSHAQIGNGNLSAYLDGGSV